MEEADNAKAAYDAASKQSEHRLRYLAPVRPDVRRGDPLWRYLKNSDRIAHDSLE